MQCTRPISIMRSLKHKGIFDVKNRNKPFVFQVPCGKCLGCRISRAREWSLRLLHEMHYHSDSIFVTLTYDNENIPKNSSINKRDLQNFIKTIRGLFYERDGRKIKYYACGEYGEVSSRPHYHLIIFGISISEFRDLSITKKSFEKYYKIPQWKFGMVHVGTVTYDSCRYVAQYIDKKYPGMLGEDLYKIQGMVPPFQLQSQGLGLLYARENMQRLSKDLHTTVRGVKCGLPRYYKKKLDIDSSLYEDFRLERFNETVKQIIKAGCKNPNEKPFYEAKILMQKERNAEIKAEIKKKRLKKL